MKPAYAREYKKFGILASRKPQRGFPVAGVVPVIGKEKRGFVYIKFSEELVTAVGKAMPQGVSNTHPCYLRAVHLVTGRWRVLAYYLGSSQGRVLWEADSLEWVKKIRTGEKDGAYTETTELTD